MNLANYDCDRGEFQTDFSQVMMRSVIQILVSCAERSVQVQMHSHLLRLTKPNTV